MLAFPSFPSFTHSFIYSLPFAPVGCVLRRARVGKLTSAACAALLLASSVSCSETEVPPRVRPGPPTLTFAFALAGTEEDCGPLVGAAPTARPGEEKASDSVLPQRLPMVPFPFPFPFPFLSFTSVRGILLCVECAVLEEQESLVGKAEC